MMSAMIKAPTLHQLKGASLVQGLWGVSGSELTFRQSLLDANSQHLGVSEFRGT